jgi:hypothetical protein
VRTRGTRWLLDHGVIFVARAGRPPLYLPGEVSANGSGSSISEIVLMIPHVNFSANSVIFGDTRRHYGERCSLRGVARLGFD